MNRALIVGLACLAAMTVCEAAVSHMEASLDFATDKQGTAAFFQCTAHENETYFVNHVMSWSRVGRDGKETFLSINWELVDGATYPLYSTQPQIYDSNGTKNLYFVLAKQVLDPSDHGEYVCRLFDFERNAMQEKRVSVVVFDEGLALSPYIVKESSGKDVAVNCMTNFTAPGFYDNHFIFLNHMLQDGTVKQVAINGQLSNPSDKMKYDVISNVTAEGIRHYIVTIKNISKSDEGHLSCEVHDMMHTPLKTTNITISVDAPSLQIKPMYFLKAPTNSNAEFQCSCGTGSYDLCTGNALSWTFIDKYTGEQMDIFKGGKLVADSALYDVAQFDGYSNLTIKGVKENVTEGHYVCTLSTAATDSVLATAQVPVSVKAVSLGALAVTDKYPDKVRLLCVLSGAQWENHYLKTHSLVWVLGQAGNNVTLSSNGDLDPSLNRTKHNLFFDTLRDFSILDISGMNETDHGDYKCRLINNNTKVVLREEILPVYGKGNGTEFAGAYNL